MELPHQETPRALRSLLRRTARMVDPGGDGECCVCGIANAAWPRFELRACGHRAHTRCLKRWWSSLLEERGDWVPCCPMCRSGDTPPSPPDQDADDDARLIATINAAIMHAIIGSVFETQSAESVIVVRQYRSM
jgi:hypothetical protein